MAIGSGVADAELFREGSKGKGGESVSGQKRQASVQKLAPQVRAVVRSRRLSRGGAFRPRVVSFRPLAIPPRGRFAITLLLRHAVSVYDYVDIANITEYLLDTNVDTVYMEVLMRVLYVFDRDEEDRREAGFSLAAWARTRDHQLISMSAPPLNPCLGCFGCWIKTPGHCVVRGDEGASFVEAMYRADLVIVGCETPYGCFSLPIKAALDRAIPLLLPYFRMYRGEMHHLPRYDALPRMLSVAFGEASEAEDSTYLELMRSFCDNIASPRQRRLFRYRGDYAALVPWLEEELRL